MPATILAHQALVLPLKWRWPRLFSGLALCIGSMAPDLAFIGAMSDDSVFSHTLGAQLWYTAPVTLALTWLVTALLIPTLLPYLRDHRWWRPHHLAALQPPQGWSEWGKVLVSGSLGGITHVLLDGITHGNHSGWLVPYFPFLRTMVPQVGGPVPLHDALQCWLTVVLTAASALMWRAMVRRDLLWTWRKRHSVSLGRMPRAEGMRLLRWCVAAGAVGGVTGGLLRRQAPLKLLAAGIGFGTIDFVLLALIVAAIVHRARMPRAETAHAVSIQALSGAESATPVPRAAA